MPALELVIVLCLILLNGFFAMSELAVVSARKPRLKAMADARQRGAEAALALIENPGRFLSSVQIGITLIGVLAGAFSGATLAGHLAVELRRLGIGPGLADTVAVVVVVAAVTYLSLIVGELVPKQVALRNPERIAALVARPMGLLGRIAAPAVWLLEVSSRFVLRLLGMGEQPEQRVTEEEIRQLIAEAESAGVVEPMERRMMTSVMRLADRSVRSLMTPRHEVEWLDLALDEASLRSRLLSCRHSRLPAGEGGIDELRGIVVVREALVRTLTTGRLDVMAALRPPTVVHDGMDALDALDSLKQSPTDMAIVVDEYGTFEGVLTTTDLLHAITGALGLQIGETEPDALQREDGSWLLDGMKPVEEVADLLRLPLPARRDYHTVAGFMLDRLRRIPQLGDAIEAGGWRLEVVDMDGRRIDKVLAQPRPVRPGSYRP
ncbi:hemolysin family protein [Benzoatithermus flavus]|uniref:Hemolysin family protein n=1 Tax=Benzoatithermus flavus TaxID=3108223 RepID=A0ABU8XN80_9PROT